ncbi:hypothetical protein TNIN_378411 [Trichonephila inaurata madagascariensis]|uniref:Uncharacterized protein n=1 Tax=Trichonephila inaurata madagascariensis TaxID=2747483 RepID=A0A8X6MKF0_9ARAC|nr:hypothetical protein TNIN_378411 [Trichonephila inaurata madagascariensis]
MQYRCLKCGETSIALVCEIKEKSKTRSCINCNAKGHMASSTECPLFPKPRKGKSKTQADNLKRNNDISMVASGLSYQALNSPTKATRWHHEEMPSASEIKINSKNNETINLKHLMLTKITHPILAYKLLSKCKNILLFPSLLSEMQKSFNCTNPADKLNCLLLKEFASLNSLTVNDV